MNNKSWKNTKEWEKRYAEKNKKLCEDNICNEIDSNKHKNRAGWAFLVLTLIVTGYFFVWAWTNF